MNRCLPLVLASLLLPAFAATAASERIHSASSESTAPCPPASVPEALKADAPAEAASTPEPSQTAAPARPVVPMHRPGLRWHSFLPGMMK